MVCAFARKGKVHVLKLVISDKESHEITFTRLGRKWLHEKVNVNLRQRLKMLRNVRMAFKQHSDNLRKLLSRSCSEYKKLLEIREVAKKLPSNLWKALDSLLHILSYTIIKDRDLTDSYSSFTHEAIMPLPFSSFSTAAITFHPLLG